MSPCATRALLHAPAYIESAPAYIDPPCATRAMLHAPAYIESAPAYILRNPKESNPEESLGPRNP